MTYEETLDYLFSQLPMFQRVGGAAYKADLSTTYNLLEAIGNPQQKPIRYIHVAGTNGKGSVSHLIAAALQSNGYKTGLFTSPHLKDFRERIKINGIPVSKEAVIEFVAKNKSVFAELKPSFFEMTTALAFEVFSAEKVDFAVLETGMGGRLDSTNVITPIISVITNIGLDHMQFLGDTIEAIAGEKAGIIKPGVPVVTGKMREEALNVIAEKALQSDSPLYKAEKTPPHVTTDLAGDWQSENLCTANTAMDVLHQNGIQLQKELTLSGFQNTVQLTGLMGRWQTIGQLPLSICDVGHNADGLRVVVKQLGKYKYNQLHFVLGMVGDKDTSTSLSLLPKNAIYYFCSAKIPRAKPATDLALEAARYGLKGEVYDSVIAAYHAARAKAHPENDLVFTGGSVFTVAEVL